MTIQDAFDSFILSRELADLSAKTVTDYRDSLRPFLAFIGPDSPVDALRLSDVQSYISKLLKRPLSRASRASYIRTYKSIPAMV